MPTLTVYGWGNNIVVYRISRNTADILAFTGIAEDKFEELFGIGGSESPIFDETGLTDDDFSISIDDKLVTNFKQSPTSNLHSKPIIELNSCYLIIDYSYKGAWVSIEFNDDFDSSKFEIDFEKYSMPSGSEITFKSISYDGNSDIGDTWGSGVDYTIVYPDRDCFSVKFNED